MTGSTVAQDRGPSPGVPARWPSWSGPAHGPWSRRAPRPGFYSTGSQLERSRRGRVSRSWGHSGWKMQDVRGLPPAQTRRPCATRNSTGPALAARAGTRLICDDKAAALQPRRSRSPGPSAWARPERRYRAQPKPDPRRLKSGTGTGEFVAPDVATGRIAALPARATGLVARRHLNAESFPKYSAKR